MKNILVVDDEIDLAESVSTFLESNGYNCDYCDSVDRALKIMAEQKFDVIISDIKMPVKDGLEFYSKIKTELKEKKMAFIFMTGHSEKVNMQSAYDMGVDEFVSKPFDLEDLKSVVNLLTAAEPDPTYANENFYKIDLQDYLQSSVNLYDIFLKVNGNYLCLVKKGQELMPERLLNYHRKGMEFIYLTSTDFSHYIGMQISISNLINNKPLQKTKKLQLFNHFCKTISESALSQHIDEQLYHKAYSSFECYTQMTFDNSDLFAMLDSFSKNSKEASSKSVLVSFLALVVFQKWNWTNPKHLSRISMAALLCDIGLKDMIHLSEKNKNDMSGDELKLYEKHPLQSYMHLSKIKNLPQEILYVAVQHHENDSGLGFPHKLSKLKIHPYARVIHALVEFVDNVEQINSKNSVKQCLDTLLGFEKKFISQQILKTLYSVFEIPVPDELKKILLPTDTARLS